MVTRERWLAIGVLLVAGSLVCCASSSATGSLDRLYPPGEPRAEAARSTSRHENTLVRSVLREAESGRLALPPGTAAALGPDRLSGAAGYDAYRARVRRGQGYSARWRQYCDYVFFDASERIVAAYRSADEC